MSNEAPTGPVSGTQGRQPAACNNPRQKIPDYRYEFLQYLPSQVLRPLAAASDRRRTILARRAYLAEFERQLSIYIQNNTIWSVSVDDSMDRRGQELIDRDDEAQCQAFLAGIGLTTLEKRYKRETAVGAAQLELERLAVELRSNGD